MKKNKIVEGLIYDPIKMVVIPGRIYIDKGKIKKIERDENIRGSIILPGFIDSHIHIESSMLTPFEFSKIAKKHGCVAVVADPHEIANVAGVEGIDFMIDNSKSAEIKFYFGAPSCVPASPFDDCCKALDSGEIKKLLSRNDIYFLGEMMNFPGVINNDEDTIKKLKFAEEYGKPIDGHAPALSNEALNKYINSGITTDHECFTIKEAEEKIALGMKVLIREGSAAKNYNTLHPLIHKYSKNIMFCTDDCHPDDLIKGHMNLLVKRSLNHGYNIFDILQITSVNPIIHYKLDVGLLQEGDNADFIVVDNLNDLNIISNYINGDDILKGKGELNVVMNNNAIDYKFVSNYKKELIQVDFSNLKSRIIEVIDGELITNIVLDKLKVENNKAVSDVERDILKIVVVNRYKENEIAIGFIKGFGLKKGAIAESIAHDSHHIIAVGVDDESIIKCLDFVIREKGGICYTDGRSVSGLSLPVYGLMSFDKAENVASAYDRINRKVIEDGCDLKSPFMTLSFMALTVIPNLKISPRGLFDVMQFKFVDLYC